MKYFQLWEQYNDIIYTDEFKEWFGDWENDPENSSKVVDSDGKPLLVYHGTYTDKPYESLRDLTYFTDVKNTAEKYPIESHYMFDTATDFMEEFDYSIEELVSDYNFNPANIDKPLFARDDGESVWVDFIPNNLYVYTCYLNIRKPKIVDKDIATDIGYLDISEEDKEMYDGYISESFEPWFYYKGVEQEKHYLPFYTKDIKVMDVSNNIEIPKA
jgi:hypothetical protein